MRSVFAQCPSESKLIKWDLSGIIIDDYDDIYTACHLILLKF